MSLDDIMGDKPFQTEEAAEETTLPEIEDIADQPEQAEQPATVKTEPQMVPLAALQEERQKSRTVTERLAQIEQMIQASQRQGDQPAPRKLPDVFEQPEAYTQSILQMMAEREAGIIAEMSERFTRSKHGDEAVDAAFETAKAAGVIDQFRGRKDPWGELVKWHKQHQVMSEIGNDPDAWRAQERDRLRQEVLAELAGQQQKQTAARGAPSLAGQPNLGARAAPAWSGPTPLSEILKG
jgi:hypothetical protein